MSSDKDMQTWVQIFNSLCILYGTPNAPQGYMDVKRRTDEIFDELKKRFKG